MIVVNYKAVPTKHKYLTVGDLRDLIEEIDNSNITVSDDAQINAASTGGGLINITSIYVSSSTEQDLR